MAIPNNIKTTPTAISMIFKTLAKPKSDSGSGDKLLTVPTAVFDKVEFVVFSATAFSALVF